MLKQSHIDDRLLKELRHSAPSDQVLQRCEDRKRCSRLYANVLTRAAKVMRGGAEKAGALLDDTLPSVSLPEKALLQLDRFLEATFSPAGILEDFISYPYQLDIFFRLVTTSGFIADVLARDPELFRWLTMTGALRKRMSPEDFLRTARDAMYRFKTSERRVNALRRYQRRHLLRIAAADLTGEADLTDTVRQLSHLADAVLELLLEESRLAVERRHNVDLDTRMVVLGLGKLGGEELNYSSDIDLMVVYERRGETKRRDVIEHRVETGSTPSAHDKVVAVVKHLIQLLTEVTREGFFYRTDFRLRPDGNSGALALSLPATLTYYENRGAGWERQMLLKARVSAGSREFGDKVLRELLPFKFPKTLARLPSELFSDIARRLRERWKEGGNVKHFRGGIRHIEFSVQALQLLGGSGKETLRASGTLAALQALRSLSILTGDEENALREGYEFFRRVEHILQLERFEQTHDLPEGDDEQRELALKLGFDGVEAFRNKLKTHRQIVSEICEIILKQDKADSDMYTESSLAALGYRRPPESLKAVMDILEGRRSAPHSVSTRRLAERTCSMLVREAASEALPDTCLRSLESFINRSPIPSVALGFLEQSSSRTLLLKMASLAPVQLRAVTRDPLVLDLLFSRRGELQSESLSPQQRKLLGDTTAAGKLLLGQFNIADYGKALTRTADELLVDMIRDSVGLNDDTPFCIMAMGKYGSRELSPGSDLDVIFLYDGRAGLAGEDAQRYAERCIRTLRGEHGLLFNVDARLRPEGKSAPLATSLEAWRRYMDKRASLWEKQALLRARIVFGPGTLGKTIRGNVDSYLTALKLGPEQQREIRDMRRKMEPVNRFGQQDFFDVKLSSGGLVDAEFVVQVLRMILPDRGVGTENMFDALAGLGCEFVGFRKQLREMAEHHDFLRLLQLRMRLLTDSTSNLYPEDRRQQEMLAWSLDFSSPADFLEEIQRRRSSMRRIYDSILQDLG